jgi:simple sugar transport system permease protein
VNAGGVESIATGALYFTVASAIVLSLAAIGELIQERAGVLNLGLEGVLIIGAFTGFYAAYRTGNPWLGYASGAISASLLGALFAGLVVNLRMNQVVTGVLLVAFALATADVMFDRLFGEAAEAPRMDTVARAAIPVLSRIPVVGPAVFRRILPEYVAVGIVTSAAWVLYRTRFGLILRAVGESPEAVHFSGYSVKAYRIIAVLIGCALAGLAGALLTVGQLGFYAPGVTAGRGWIAIAVVIMGGWRPWGVMVSAVIFGAADMLQFEVQAAGFHLIPFEFLVAIPYVVVVVALLVRRRSVRPPSALGEPFTG